MTLVAASLTVVSSAATVAVAETAKSIMSESKTAVNLEALLILSTNLLYLENSHGYYNTYFVPKGQYVTVIVNFLFINITIFIAYKQLFSCNESDYFYLFTLINQ